MEDIYDINEIVFHRFVERQNSDREFCPDLPVSSLANSIFSLPAQVEMPYRLVGGIESGEKIRKAERRDQEYKHGLHWDTERG